MEEFTKALIMMVNRNLLSEKDALRLFLEATEHWFGHDHEEEEANESKKN